ncbi:serine hydrolase domain-containing protein [Actinotalea sp.]|uniref:serine hydrolase domain-containing protein n=1 Tax=Actinotalea sp. TaxID=1872145 RepID=UPI0035696DAC
MLTRGRVLLGLVLLVVVVVVGVYWYERPLLLTATGYAAHNACAVEGIAQRSDPQADLPENPLVPVLRTSSDGDRTAGSILGVLATQRAVLTEGFGCTLTDEAPTLPAPVEVDPGGNPFADAPAPAMSPEVEAALGRAFGDGLDADARAALGTRAVVAVRGGELLAERYAEGFDDATPQLGWSMSKSLTNLLVGRLVAQGRLSLDDDHLRAQWTDERAEITVEQLLRMTSGLEWNETYDLGTAITRMLYLEPDMGDYVAAQPLAHEPGTYQQYSSGSTTLLCDILLERTGSDANLPREEVFGPLGMSSAVLEPDASGTPVCSSYLWATPRDFAALGQFALQDGEWAGEQLLPAGWMARSTTAVDVETEDPGYGAGWWVNTLPDGTPVHPELPDDAYFAQGHDGQWIVVVPSAELVVVRLGFSPEVDDEGVVALAATLVDLS